MGRDLGEAACNSHSHGHSHSHHHHHHEPKESSVKELLADKNPSSPDFMANNLSSFQQLYSVQMAVMNQFNKPKD